MNKNDGILGSYLRGLEAGRKDHNDPNNTDWADLTGCCPYYKDGYARGYLKG